MAETNLLNELKAMFPWIDQIGLSASWFQQTAANAASADEIVQLIRGTKQWKSRFPGIMRGDSTLRMSEAEYIRTETDYRTVLRQFGRDVDKNYSTPSQMIGFFDAEMDPNELRDRLTIYRQLEGPGGQRVREAFYVYADMDISVDDLFEAAIDPAAEQRLNLEYNQKAAALAPDYKAWIQRATQAGLNRVVDTLKRMQTQGAVTGQVVQRILAVDPNFAREIMHQLYKGTGGGGMTGALPLQDLLESFEYATIGAAAKGSGLELPTKERLMEIRNAGIERARAIQGYQDFGQNKEIYQAAVQRARGTKFGQKEFEQAAFLGDAAQASALEAGVGYMEGIGRSQGQFRFAEVDGRIGQRGLRVA